MQNLDNEIAERISEMAKRQGVTNSYLCRKLGLRVSYLTEVKNGKASITMNRAEQFAKLLGVSTDELMYDFETDPDDILADMPIEQRKVLLERNHYDVYETWKEWQQMEADGGAKEKSPSVSDEDLKFALFDGDKDIPDEVLDEVKRFAAYAKERYGKK